MIQQQSIGLKNVGNARELGGYPIGDRRIRRGLLLRSARLSGATDEDIQILSDTYRLGAVADLRMTVEQEEHPDRPIPGAVHYSLPVMEFVEEGLSPDMEAFIDPNTDRVAWIQNAVDFGFFNDRFYIDFLRPEMGRSTWRKFFQILLDLPDDRAILWHCTDGKDRTGVAAMLLLSALGADRDLILRDYLLTNSFNADKLEAGRRALSSIPLSQERREIYLFSTAGGVFARFLENAMADLESAYGSIEGYLSAELGIGPGERDILRRKYLE